MRTAIFISSIVLAINPSFLSSSLMTGGGVIFFFLFFGIWDLIETFKPKLLIKDKTGKIVGTISEE